ncbi:MAG: hypothetical protein ACOH2H_16290 [Cypionkella sp.]
MKLIENWFQVLWKSISMWCLYIASIAAAVHGYILQTAPGPILQGVVAQVDGWAVLITFVAGLTAIPARFVDQGGLPKPPA